MLIYKSTQKSAESTSGPIQAHDIDKAPEFTVRSYQFHKQLQTQL